MNGIIYCATFPNGRIYIGQTVQPLEARKSQHKWYAMHMKDKFIFHSAIRKHGFDVVTWEVLEQGIQTHDELNEREIFWIAEKNSYCRDNKKGCNMTRGGDNYEHMYKFSPEEAMQIVEEYKELGNSKIIGDKYGTTSSVIMRYVKALLPDYQQYSFNGKGSPRMFDEKESQEIYEYYKTTGSIDMTIEHFNSNPHTIARTLKRVDSNYMQYRWHYKVPKLQAFELLEEFKQDGSIDRLVKKYGYTRTAIQACLKALDENYMQYRDTSNYSKQEREAIYKEYLEVCDDELLAKKYGLHVSTLRLYLKEFDPDYEKIWVKGKFSKAECLQIYQDYLECHNIEQLRHKYGVCAQTIRNALKKINPDYKTATI